FRMDLKSVVKNGKKLLAAGQFREAYAVLKGAIDEGEEDYLLFCLVALAASTDEKVEEAEKMYRKAIELDGKSLTAWQGLNKMYSMGMLSVDGRALEAVDILLKESEESKREVLAKDRRRYLIGLRKWSCLSKEDLDSEKEWIPKILEFLLSEGKELSEEDTNTCSRCFSILGDDLTSDAALRKAIFEYKTRGYSAWSRCVFDSRVDGDNNEWVAEKRRLAMAIQYVMEGRIKAEWRELIGEDTHDTLFRYLFAMDDGDSTLACEILESIEWGGSLSSIKLDSASTPLAIASLPVLIRDEQFEVARKRIQSLNTQFLADSEVFEWLRGCEAECLLKAGEHLAASLAIPLPRPSFALIEARILVENGKEVDSPLMESLTTVDRLRLEVRQLLKEGKKKEAEEKCSGLDESEWEDVLLEAECSSPSKGLNLLVKAAKLNPRCSRAFYLLASILRGKNKTKAISLVERAASIREGNEEYAQLVEELMCENGEKEEARLVCLQRFAHATPRLPEWTRLSISRLLLHSNRVDEALFLLQEGIGEASSAVRWALLGEAYALRGQLSSSISSFEESLKRERNLHIVVSMLGVSLRVGDSLRTIEMCNEWMEEARETPAITPILIILSKTTLALCGEDKGRLPSLFSHLGDLLSFASPSTITCTSVYKLFGDSLVMLSKTSQSIFSSVTAPPQWNIKDRISCLKLATNFYSKCGEISRDEGWYWADCSLSLFLLWQMEKDDLLLERARKCLVHSIQLSKQKRKTSRSKLWNYMAMIEEARGEGSLRIRHCLARSIQLDARNDEAWLRLGVLLWKEGEVRSASECIEKCTKWNPLRSEGWSVWAEISCATGNLEDGEDMFRHSLSVAPTMWGVSRYTQVVSERIVEGSKWNPARLLIDTKRILELRNSPLPSKEDGLRLGVLAELCGCFEEAMGIFESVGDSVHKERNKLKYSCLPSSSAGFPGQNLLSDLVKLCGATNERLRELLEVCGCVVDGREKKEVVVEEEREGEEGGGRVKTVYPSLSLPHSIPLLISSIIAFHLDPEDGFISALHDLSPRDELIDYYPTVVPEDADNGIRFISKDGEEPYRIHNEVARDLLAILKKRRQMQANS
ncbi:hypothetical protein PMAYCL1PPCAC_23752, partial [Pristionchus mayeri]